MDSLFSDVDSLSESWSSEDQDDMNSLFGGQARSIFLSIEDTITKIDDFLLFERGFMQNDIVRMVSEQLGQTGKVVNLDLTVDLENIYGSKLQNVSAKNLQKMRLMSVGDYVVHGAWIGKVEKIVDSLTILFDDGTKCQLTVAGPEKIIVVSPDVIEDPQYPFYPGQRVKVESLSIKPTRWLCGRKDNPDEGTVCSVEAGLVYVEWLSCLFTNGEKGSSPDSLQNSKDLSLLSSFTPANWQLGDWCVHNGTPSSNFPEITVITKTKSKVDVQWQDGSQTFGLDSHLLFPVNVIDAHDFWPDMLVLEKVTVDDTQVGGSQRWGVVISVDSKERTVKVKWQKSSSGGLGFEEEDMEEIVSAYELVEHPEFSYCLGEAVFRTDKRVADLEPAECGESQIENVNNNLSSHIGIVVGFKDGKIEVKWATGTTSKVAPYEIRRVDNCEGATTTSVLPNETIQQSQEELPVKPNQLSGQKLQDVSDIHCGSTRDSNSYSLSEIAFGVLSSITSSLFGSVNTSLTRAYKVAAEEGEILDESPKEQVLELCSLTLDEQVPVLDDSEIFVNKTSEKIKESNENMTLPSFNKHAESFKRFDMVSDCSDHHFVDGAGMRSTQVKTSWLKKVHREWGILEKDLPETMYVRVYEERMDLLRAAIVGAAGTPYHDNLFLFDIYLPQQYPNEPPMVYYNSGGLRVNPNLYESGKVCLSLLNTWTGSGSEVWNPECSTILQVLLSLQALVLNERPYFNEAGYDSQIGKAEGEKNSISYNENAFLVSCRSMLYLLRKPPKHFEGLVDEHFSERGRGILSACKAYMEGAPIGYPFSWEEADQQNPNSTGFKIMLSKLIPRLAEAFSEKGSMT